jgi:hypothetical protein
MWPFCCPTEESVQYQRINCTPVNKTFLHNRWVMWICLSQMLSFQSAVINDCFFGLTVHIQDYFHFPDACIYTWAKLGVEHMHTRAQSVWNMCSKWRLKMFADSLVWWVTDIPNPWKPPLPKRECVEQVWEWHEGGRQRGSRCVAGSHQHTIIIHCFWVPCDEARAPHQELLSSASRAPHGHEVSYINISSFADSVGIRKRMLQFVFMHIITTYRAVEIVSVNCVARLRGASCAGCAVLTGYPKCLFCIKHKKWGGNYFVISNREYIYFYSPLSRVLMFVCYDRNIVRC